jgi:hypothetical protein
MQKMTASAAHIIISPSDGQRNKRRPSVVPPFEFPQRVAEFSGRRSNQRRTPSLAQKCE